MNILVTGGAGFIGSHLVEELVRLKHKVTVIDDLSTGKLENLESVIDKISFREDGLEYFEFIDSIKNIDIIFHLAATVSIQDCIEDIYDSFCNNEENIINLFEGAKEKGIKKIICASSAAAKNPDNPYAIQKRTMEDYADFYNKHYNMDICCLRFMNVYGPRQDFNSDYSGVIAKFINNFLDNKQCTIYGDGEQTREFVYVKDIVKTLVEIMKSKNIRQFNRVDVGSGRQDSINELYDLISISFDDFPFRFPLYEDSREEVKHSKSDMIGYFYKLSKEFKSFPEGLNETIKWYKEQYRC